MNLKKIWSFFAISSLIIVPTLFAVVSCGSDNGWAGGTGNIVIFSKKTIKNQSFDGRSFDASYAGNTLSDPMKQTKVTYQSIDTTGRYSDFNPTDGFLNKPTSTIYNELLANDQNVIPTPVKTTDNYQTLTLKIKSGFGYVDKNGNPVKVFDQKNQKGKLLNINKWDLLLGLARFQIALEGSSDGSLPPNFNKQVRIIKTLGIDINATFKANLTNLNSNVFLIKMTSPFLESSLSELYNLDFLSAPVPVAYVAKLFKGENKTKYANKSFLDILKNANLKTEYLPGDNRYLMNTTVKAYVIATIKTYGEDTANYANNNVVYSGKYYLASYQQGKEATFKLNPYYNMQQKTFTNDWSKPLYTNPKNNSDKKIFRQIKVLFSAGLSNQPSVDAYNLWQDKKVNLLDEQNIPLNSKDNIIDQYRNQIHFSGEAPDKLMNKIFFNMNIWNKNALLNNKVSTNYEKLVKNFYSVAAQDLRYNLMKAVNWVAISNIVNPEKNSIENNSIAPQGWEKINNVDIAKLQDQQATSLFGGNTSKILKQYVNSDNYTTKNIPTINIPEIRNKIKNDLKALGITTVDTVPNLNPNLAKLNFYYRTSKNLSQTELKMINEIAAVWQDVSDKDVDLHVQVADPNEIQKNTNDEIGDNITIPTFGNGIGSWINTIGKKDFNAPDIVYGLAKTGALSGTMTQPTGYNQNVDIDFSDLSTYILKHKNYIIKPSSQKLENKNDLVKLILDANELNNRIDPSLWISSQTKKMTDSIAQLISSWLNDKKNAFEVTGNSNAIAQFAYKLTTWMNIESISIPLPQPNGTSATNLFLTSNDLIVKKQQTDQLFIDWTDQFNQQIY